MRSRRVLLAVDLTVDAFQETPEEVLPAGRILRRRGQGQPQVGYYYVEAKDIDRSLIDRGESNRRTVRSVRTGRTA